MEASVATPPAAQPQGQGTEGSGSGLYDLNQAPEELRPYLEQELRKVDGNVTRRFQEAADFRSQAEPYLNVAGLTDFSPEDLGQLIAFAQMAQDPQQFAAWVAQAAAQTGYVPEELPQETWEEIGQRNGWLDESGLQPESDQAAQFQTMLQQFASQIEERLSPFEQRLGVQEQEQRTQIAAEQIESELAELHQEHGEFDDDAVAQLALAYGEAEDSLQRGLQDYLRITGQAQGELVDGKLAQPNGALNGGGADTAPERFNGIDDPNLKAAALARFRG